MNMKRQVGVSIFLAVLVIVLAWLYIKFSNEIQPKENEITTENDISKEEAVTISQPDPSFLYFTNILLNRKISNKQTRFCSINRA